MAAGKTMVGSTAYDITGGKTMSGGTAYDITGGKTMSGGTAYDISFGSQAVTLADLFSDIEILGIAGRNSNSKGYVDLAKSSDSRTQYLWSFLPTGLVGAAWGIYQVKGGNVTKTVKATTGLYGGYYNDGTKWWYANSAGASEASSIYGCTFALVTFPATYSDATVENLLGSFGSAVLDSNGANTIWSTPSAATVYTTNKSYRFAICVRAAQMDIRVGSSNTYDVIKKTSTAAANVSGSGSSSRLTLGGTSSSTVYVGAIIGVNEPSS